MSSTDPGDLPTDLPSDPAHRQAAHVVRLDWGPTGAAALTADAGPGDVAVVVDVLSFTTTLSVAVGRGVAVLPYRWRDDGAAAYAAERDAVLAVGRLEARDDARGLSLSPAALASATDDDLPRRLVLPSPNGSSIAFGLAGSGATVVGGCLRNAPAVAAWLAPRLDDGARLAVVAAGERWPDGSLRPAAEDLWGAGAVLAALLDLRPVLSDDAVSPEARLAADAWRAVAPRLPAALHACAGGRELAAVGFAADVEVAAAHDVSRVVPVLVGEEFVPAG